MPSFWSDNYFSLAANESHTVTISCPRAKLTDLEPVVTTTAWNVQGKLKILKKLAGDFKI